MQETIQESLLSQRLSEFVADMGDILERHKSLWNIKTFPTENLEMSDSSAARILKQKLEKIFAVFEGENSLQLESNDSLKEAGPDIEYLQNFEISQKNALNLLSGLGLAEKENPGWFQAFRVKQ